MSENLENAGRRRLLTGTAGAVAAVAIGNQAVAQGSGAASKSADAAKASAEATPLPEYAAWKDADSLIVHSANTIETRRHAFGDGVITPANRLFVRNNLPPPSPSILDDRDAWKISIEGVKSPRTFTVGELKTMGIETMATVLQCSGNGRGFFPHKPSGTPWEVGAAGCVMWTGVPVKEIVKAVGGVADGMVYMTGTGGEPIPEGIDPNTIMVERSVPLEAMEDAMLVWEMNGEPLTLAHGGPLRLIVPGYTGVNNVKYIKRLAFTTEQSQARIQQTSYRIAPLDGKPAPDQPSAWEMPVKSWVNSPNPDNTVQAGRVILKGVAFGGVNPVERVEVSVDGGKNWQQAKFVGPDLGRYAWRQFALPVELKAGTYEVVSRAFDSKGNEQLEERDENFRGYLNSSWRDHALQLKVIA